MRTNHLLDFFTALVLWSSASITIAAVLLLIWWRDRAFTAGLWWGSGFAATALSAALIAARGHVPDLLSIEAANTIMLTGLGCWVAGVSVHCGRTPRPWVLLPALLWVAGMFVPAVRDSLAARISLCSAAAAIAYGMMLVQIWPGWRDRSARRALAFVFLFQTNKNIATAVLVTAFPPTRLDVFPYAPIAALTALLALILVVIYGAKLVMERSEQKLRVLAYTDPLTHALNRRGLIERFDAMAAARHGTGRSIALLVFDLDHFKRVNDQFGHLAGDAALAGFARLAKSCLRPDDAFGRLGGEEFAAVLAIDHAAEATAVAEQLRTALAAQPILFAQLRIPLTVSVGVAAMRSDRADFGALMSEADRALYAAKISGRNQTRTDDGAPHRSVVTPLPVVAPLRLQASALAS
jgi:diguanylate cyclase (GGDEF)-like protein